MCDAAERMVISTINEKGAQEKGNINATDIATAKDKIGGRQMIINLYCRNLVSNRSLPTANSDLRSMIRTLQTKLYKFFAEQLEVKHTALQSIEDPDKRLTVEKELDTLIDMKSFCEVAGLTEIDIKGMLELQPKVTVGQLFKESSYSIFHDDMYAFLSSESQEKLKTAISQLREVHATVRKQDGRIDSISDTPPATPTITVPSPKSTYLPPNRSFAQIPQNRFDGVSDCYRSTESIETPVQTQFLSIRNVKKGHYRSRSVGSEYSIDNAPNNLHMVKEPSPIPSYLQPNGRRMVKQQSTESALPRIRTGSFFPTSGIGETSSLVEYDPEDDFETSVNDRESSGLKSQSVPRLVEDSVSVSPETDDLKGAFTRSYSEGMPDPYPQQVSPNTGTSTPVGHVGHRIPHRFASSSFFASKTCDFCKKSLYLGVQCKLCKIRCHKHCKKKVPESCGLTAELVDVFTSIILGAPSTSSTDNFHKDTPKTYISATKASSYQQGLPSPSVSSSHSSTPSPATPISPHTTQAFFSAVQGDDSSEQEVESQDGITQLSLAHTGKFSSVDDITDLSPTSQRGRRPHPQIVPIGSLPDLHKPKTIAEISFSQHSELESLLRTNASIVTTSTLTDGSNGCIESEVGSIANTITNSISSENQADTYDVEDPTNLAESSASNQFQMHKEWEIPYNDLKLLKLVSENRFTSMQILKGYWHGEVLVKKIHVPNATKRQIEKFTHDVAALKHSRHENVVLFMGVCSKPPDLAVVTSDIKGDSLYSRIHIRPETFNSRRVHTIIKQVAQGMGYLHERNIVHKDLTSRNIFFDEKDKVVITDVGFNSVTDCQLLIGGQQDRLVVPRGWLNYVAPEILQVLSPVPSNSECMDCYPYTFQSDIYAFGVVWYELLAGKWPFEGYEPEQVIYMVGNGLKPKRDSISLPAKDLLFNCWNYTPEERPPFSRILAELKRRIPVTRIGSHPSKLSNSMDSIFS